jgi:hypothetical protein
VTGVRAELRASLDEMMVGYNQQLERLKEMRRALDEVSATAKSRDGMVTVVVGPRGQVQDQPPSVPDEERRLARPAPSRRSAAA